MTSLICPYTDKCIIYGNWKEETGSERVNIILHFSVSGYNCLALDAHSDICGEGGITFNNEISRRIESLEVKNNISLGDVGCSHITLLNLLRNNKNEH